MYEEVENPMVLGDCAYDRYKDTEEEKAEEFCKAVDRAYEEYVARKLEYGW